MTTEIPVVDMAQIAGDCSSDENSWKNVADQLGKALHDIGFVFLINHGVEEEVVNEAFSRNKTFFQLPLETKRKYAKEDATEDFNGFQDVGFELLNLSSSLEVKESYDVTTRGARFPDTEVPEFRPAMVRLMKSCEGLTKTLLKLLAIALRLDDSDFFVNAIEYYNNPSVKNVTGMRNLYYPPLTEEMLPSAYEDGIVRCAEHTDWGLITLLFQDKVGGLEVRAAGGPDAPWVSVSSAIPGAILLNTGNLLEDWSRAYFPATPHRILASADDVRLQVPRHSIAYFVYPDDKQVISALEKSEILVQEGKKVFEPYTVADSFKQNINKYIIHKADPTNETDPSA